MKKQTFLSLSLDPVESLEGKLEYAKKMSKKVDLIHCDVMDSVFVSKKTYDESFIGSLNMCCTNLLDVHLMVNEPYALIDSYIEKGSNILTVHYEAFKNKNDIIKSIKKIKALGALAGLSIKPETEFKYFRPFCIDVDLVLVMSVEPGLSGQKFIEDTLSKVREISKFRDENGLKFKIEVDGGIDDTNAKAIIDCGADILVSGSYLFKSKDRVSSINKLKDL